MSGKTSKLSFWNLRSPTLFSFFGFPLLLYYFYHFPTWALASGFWALLAIDQSQSLARTFKPSAHSKRLFNTFPARELECSSHSSTFPLSENSEKKVAKQVGNGGAGDPPPYLLCLVLASETHKQASEMSARLQRKWRGKSKTNPAGGRQQQRQQRPQKRKTDKEAIFFGLLSTGIFQLGNNFVKCDSSNDL